jgi:phosphatidylserine/phosphatidylglycerophosphate/cardiolipin synthase-like enzyme
VKRPVNELHSDTLWKTVKRLARKSAVKRAAVAYATSGEMVRFGEGDLLVTDASDDAIAGGQTDAEVLAWAFDRGARLYSLDGLHTKVLLLDGVAVIGSANLSASSSASLIEAAWVTDHPAAVGMASSLIEQLVEQGTEIDAAFLARARTVPVTARAGKAATRKLGTKVKLPPHQT